MAAVKGAQSGAEVVGLSCQLNHHFDHRGLRISTKASLLERFPFIFHRVSIHDLSWLSVASHYQNVTRTQNVTAIGIDHATFSARGSPLT